MEIKNNNTESSTNTANSKIHRETYIAKYGCEKEYFSLKKCLVENHDEDYICEPLYEEIGRCITASHRNSLYPSNKSS